MATFQVAMQTDLGATVKRKFYYRAVAGMSMGGIGASMYFSVIPTASMPSVCSGPIRDRI